MMKWSANVRRAYYLGLIEANEARRAREKAANPLTHRATVRKFVREHPGCTYREIADGVGLTLDQVYGCALPQYQQFVRSSTPKAHWWALKEEKKSEEKDHELQCLPT